MDEIMANIHGFAEQGKTSITNPCSGLEAGYPSHSEQEAIAIALMRLGYKVVDHPDPDPGHPCSGPYTTVSWA